MADVQVSSGEPAPRNSGGATLEAGRAAADATARRAKDGVRAAEAAADKAAEASRAAVQANSEILRTQIETAQQAVRSSLEAGVRSLEGLTQNWTRTFGASAPNPDLTERSAQNLQAMSQVSSALAKGAQDASRAWLDLTQKTVRTNLEALGQLGGCRSMKELAGVQGHLMRETLQQAIESGEVVARVSADAIQEAARVMRSQAQPAS
jgi:hypothetical protein